MSNVFDAQGLTPNQKLVMLALSDYAADDGTSIYPSIKTLASKTALSGSSIRNAIRELRNPDGLNLLTVVSHYTNRRPNRYAINVKNLRALSPDTQKSSVSSPDTQGVTTKHPRVSPPDTDPSVYPSPDPSESLQQKIEAYLHTVYNGTYVQINPVIRIDDVLGKIAIGVETDAPQLAAQVRAYIKGTPQRKYKVSVAVVPSVTGGSSLSPIDRLKSDLADEYYKCRGGAVFIDDNIERSALAHLAGNNWTRDMLRAKYTELNTKWRQDNNVPVTLAAIAKHLPGATHAATLATPAPVYTDAQRAAAEAINAHNRARRAQAGL